jgi:cell division protein FtsI (penicillin-binding protein 3)
MKQAPRQTLTAPIRRIRFVYVASFFCFWVAMIVVRLGWVQVVRHGEFVRRAAQQQQRTFEVAPRRGILYDRNLRELAMTVLVDSVYAVPSELGDNRENAAELLSEVVHQPDDSYTSKKRILARFNASRNFAWVARKLDRETAERVRELNLKGVYFQKEFKRFYPNNDLAAQVLGYVGTDDKGLGGLELEFDDDMHGTPGHMLTALDAKRHVLGSEESQPLPGENLILTVDANIQYMAERALDAQMEKVKALHGTVVVQDPHTGQILALAISPRFNPNDSRHMLPGSLTDLAVSNIYEPGSTFKLVTYSAAIDAAGVQPDDLVDCQGGAITLFGRTIHDDISDRGMGVVTVQRALEKSSDVAAVKLALKLGPDKFYKYIRGYGFGDRSGIELPSETRGLLRPPSRWGATSIGSLAIGQEIGVTPIQLVTMVSTIANGGVYLPPHILLNSTNQMKGDPRLKPVAFRPENELPDPLPDGAHRVISELTSAKMRKMMQGIVLEGTGKAAALNGYSSAGKTGTAQKVDPETHTYSHTKLVASFAGFAPVNHPAISVTVVIDNPTAGPSKYGAAVSAPVFAEVAQQVLEYLGVPHDQPLKEKKAAPILTAKDLADDNPGDSTADLTAMFDDANNLPADDPLRNPNAAATAQAVAAEKGSSMETKVKPNVKSRRIVDLLPAKVLSALKAGGGMSSAMPDAANGESARLEPAKTEPTQFRGGHDVLVDAGKRVSVPVFNGAGLRAAVEKADAAGLRLKPVGSGLAREQVPAAGTMVPLGTEIVVRFTR